MNLVLKQIVLFLFYFFWKQLLLVKAFLPKVGWKAIFLRQLFDVEVVEVTAGEAAVELASEEEHFGAIFCVKTITSVRYEIWDRTETLGKTQGFYQNFDMYRRRRRGSCRRAGQHVVACRQQRDTGSTRASCSG